MADSAVIHASPKPSRLRVVLLAPICALEAARGQLLPLAAVAFGCGVGIWFGLSHDPPATAYMALTAASLGLLCLALRGAEPWRATAGLALALCLGFLTAGLRAELQAAPMLGYRYYGPIEGRVVEIDRSSSDALRLTLDHLVLERTAAAATPHRLRISLLEAPRWLIPLPGQRVIVTGHLSPPAGPAEPGGFDFQRMAYFERLGAVGYSRTPILLLEPPQGADQLIGRLRSHFSAAIQEHIQGEAGAFAAGAMTGDRSGISQETVAALRDSSLAHILAISGMNLACLSGFVFALIRGAIALVPWLALRVNAKKIAAGMALPVAWFYLQLSGANLATERAFVMICIMLGAVLLDRRAISLRSAGIAGLVMLGLRPESLIAPGFQMSMAATLGLILGIQAMERGSRLPRWLLPVTTVILSSLIGGLATAPFAAAHFNRFAEYGFLANLLTVPVMGIAIMPMGVLAFLLAPFGLAFLPLWVMGMASAWILWVAHHVAAWEGAVLALPTPHWLALPLFSLGALWLALWPGRARLMGLALAVLGLGIWPLAPRPDLLIAADAGLVGLMTEAGRSLSLPRGNGITAQSWLENDGDLALQDLAATRRGFDGPNSARDFSFNGWKAVILRGKSGADQLEAACRDQDLVILDDTALRELRKFGAALPDACPLISAQMLRQTGALAAYNTGAGSAELRGARRHRRWAGDTPPAPDLAWTLPNGLSGPEGRP